MEHRVLFTASTFSHIQNFHQPYLRAFHDRGWRVDVACGGQKKELPFADRVIELPFEKKMSSPSNFRAAGILRGEISRERYDLICANTALAAFFVRLALTGARRRPKVLNMVHGYLFDDETAWPKKRVLLAAEQMTAPQTDLLLTMNRYDFKLAERHRLGKKVVHIPGVGVDFTAFDEQRALGPADLRRSLELPENAFVLIYAAEFSSRKNQTMLIRALKELPDRVFLILAGEGSTLEQCRELASSLQLEDRVRFPGYVRPVGAWYDASDAVVSASRSEGLPFNIMEAMHAGLPVVASDVKGNSDLIRDGENGLLYPFGDAAACAERIRRLLDSEDERRRLGAQARLDAEQYDLERVFPKVWAQFESLTDAEEFAGASAR